MKTTGIGLAAPLVDLAGISKTFANGTTAVDGVAFSIRQGEFVSFLGPSGCGKSTILRLIAGLEPPTSGSMFVRGAANRRRSEVAFVFQDPTLMPWLSVERNVALPLVLARVPRAEITTSVARVLELVGLAAHARDLPRQLSGGMKMRVSIARALIAEPRSLLMDEPFAALDEITRQALQEEVLAIFQNAPGTSVLFVTHNVFEAAYLSSRVIVLAPRPGRIVADIPGHPAMLRRPQDFRASEDFGSLVADVSGALASAVGTVGPGVTR